VTIRADRRSAHRSARCDKRITAAGSLLISVVLALAAFAVAGPGARADEPDAAALFKAQCARCHGEDGLSQTAAGKAMKVPPVKDTDLPASEIAVFLTDNPKHKALGAKLSEAERLALGSYLAGM
jgi:mono/diheme cytochrome c family protein